jgi:hypothetical protein
MALKIKIKQYRMRDPFINDSPSDTVPAFVSFAFGDVGVFWEEAGIHGKRKEEKERGNEKESTI